MQSQFKKLRIICCVLINGYDIFVIVIRQKHIINVASKTEPIQYNSLQYYFKNEYRKRIVITGKYCKGIKIFLHDFQCRILLHLIRQNRQKKVIGIATVDVVKESNQGWKFYQFGQCADCQADIEVSVTYSSAFQLGVRSQIGYFNQNYSPNEGGQMQNSRGIQSFRQDSIMDKQQYNVLKQSKAVSNIDFIPISRRAQRPSLKLRVKRNTDIKNLRKPKPQKFTQCAPQQIITHYQTEIKTLQQQIKDRDTWALGMKELVQQLQAQNQLLKEIRIQELADYQVRNLEEGIELVSKMVHSKFQASRSALHESLQDSKLNKSLQQQHRQSSLNGQKLMQQSQPQTKKQRSLTQTKSYKDLPLSSQRNQQSQNIGKIPVVQSRQQLQNALSILTGKPQSGQRQLILTQNVKISQLQQQIFKIRQQKQQLYDMSQQLYSELKKVKQQRDGFIYNLQELQHEHDRLREYIEKIKQENGKLKADLEKYEKMSGDNEIEKMVKENSEVKDRVKELERQLKESVKAIQQFKNDALNAREEIINKEEELKDYKLKFGELGSMTEVLLNSVNNNKANSSTKIKQPQTAFSEIHISKNPTSLSTTSTATNLHSLYSHLLQTTISDRKQLQHSLSQIISSGHLSSPASQSKVSQQKLKRLQTAVQKMFIDILKNRSQIKNLKQIQRSKVQIIKQVDELMIVGC